MTNIAKVNKKAKQKSNVSLEFDMLRCSKDICHVSNWLIQQEVWSGIPLFFDLSFLLHKFPLQ